MTDERPAFSLEAGKRSTSGLPVEAWVLAMAGSGALAGAILAHEPIPCGPFANCVSLPIALPAIELLSVALFSAALAWFALPVREEREALLRAAGLAALVAGTVAVV